MSVRVPEDIVKWPANKEEILDKVRELNAMIDSMVTGEIQPWPGTEKIGDLFIF